MGIWLWRSRLEAPQPPAAPVPLTTLDGIETEPSFSPDGSQVVFAWNGEKQDNFDIYVKIVGSTDAPLRLTTDPAPDRRPAWSPDGRYVAFGRQGHGLFLISPIGGRERKLLGLPAEAPAPSWSADSQHLVFARGRSDTGEGGVFLIGIEGGEARRLTTAASPGVLRAAVLSPDSRSLAFSFCRGMNCDLSVIDLDDGLNPTGSARLFARVAGSAYGIAWTRDGSGVLFSEFDGLNIGAGQRLRRVAIDGRSEPHAAGFPTQGAAHATIARSGTRMAYSHVYSDVDIWKIENGAFSRSALSSTLSDVSPQWSPDGKRVAFASHRSGRQEVWIANADGSNAVPVTSSRASGTPRWSPDSRLIVYDTLSARNDWDIAVVDPNGGPSKVVAPHPAGDIAPSFSRDGQWIYFASNRDGRAGIYKVRAAGGEPVRVSNRHGAAFESIDGKSIYVAAAGLQCAPLFVQSLAGGPERELIDSVCRRVFAVTERGIYHIGSSSDREFTSELQFNVRLMDPATGQSRIVGKSEGRLYLGQGLTVSPDGNTILMSGSTHSGADLYLVENFR